MDKNGNDFAVTEAIHWLTLFGSSGTNTKGKVALFTHTGKR